MYSEFLTTFVYFLRSKNSGHVYLLNTYSVHTFICYEPMSISKLDASRIAQYSSRHGPFTHGAPDLIGEKEKKENVSTEHVFHSILHSHCHSHWN